MRRRVHFVGIGGAGLSAIAHVLHDRGDHVTGSDQAMSAYARALEAAGVQIFLGHDNRYIPGADLVIASSAIPESNVELVAARQLGIPVLRRKTFLMELTADYETIAVAGTHGKTTTTGLIAWILDQAGMDPGFIVGGLLGDFGANGKAGSGKYFVIEADEYDRAFLGLHPKIALVTNMEYDHPDCYPTEHELFEAFTQFINQVKDTFVVCVTNPGAAALHAEGLKRITYGIDSIADWRAEEIRPNPAGGMDFLAIRHGELLGLVRTRLPGMHNVENTLGAMAVADELGIPFTQIRQAITGYHGAGQRFEILGEGKGVTVVDDYAHHPTEIRATLSTARLRFPEAQIWAVFQPHTYSRIRALLAAYITAFHDADHVIITQVFGAREQPDGVITGEYLSKQINHPDVKHMEDFTILAKHLYEQVKPGDVVVTLSAGDANEVGKLLLELLEGGEKGLSDV
ncbi:MAG: UDP-N-acetylmuramate--L-alanine ligase [Chloroflexi bacterium RBG_16_48_8]|nr:MAG: UDP-N-acetylmuramate--L-alanine ligase [Chloroflexi bacterium RBG_16_48_8]